LVILYEAFHDALSLEHKEPEVQSAVPVHPYVKGKLVAMGSELLDYAEEGRISGELLA
jgi:hypothetical protein